MRAKLAVHAEFSAILLRMAEFSANEAAHPDVRRTVVWKMVDLAAAACELVARMSETDPGAIKALAASRTYWPIRYSVHPLDAGRYPSKYTHPHCVTEIGLGSAAPINLKGWQPRSLRTRWAEEFRRLVERCRAFSFAEESHRRLTEAWRDCIGEDGLLIGVEFPGFTVIERDGWVSIEGFEPILRGDCEALHKLPPLSRDAAVIKEWGRAFKLHLERRYPREGALDLPEWKEYFERPKKDGTPKKPYESSGTMISKIADEVAAGLVTVAKRQALSRPKSAPVVG